MHTLILQLHVFNQGYFQHVMQIQRKQLALHLLFSHVNRYIPVLKLNLV